MAVLGLTEIIFINLFEAMDFSIGGQINVVNSSKVTEV
jgi:hypothetical protein